MRADTITQTHRLMCVGSWAPLVTPFLSEMGLGVDPDAEVCVVVGAYQRSKAEELREKGVSVRFVTEGTDPWLDAFLPPTAVVGEKSLPAILEGALLLVGQTELVSLFHEAMELVDPHQAEHDAEALQRLVRLRHPVLRVPFGTTNQYRPVLALLKTRNPFIRMREDGRSGGREDFPERGLGNRIFLASLLWQKYGFVEPYFGDFQTVQA